MSTNRHRQAKTLPSATASEVEWAVQRALRTHASDFIRRGISRAPTEDDALAFVRYYQNGSMCGPSGAPGDGRYWIEFERDGIRAWFGDSERHSQGEDFQPGSRYVKISWTHVVRRVRAEADSAASDTSPALF